MLNSYMQADLSKVNLGGIDLKHNANLGEPESTIWGLDFDEINDHLVIPDDPTLDFPTTLTLMACVSPTVLHTPTQSFWPTIISKKANTTWTSPYARYNLRLSALDGNVFQFWTQQFTGRDVEGTTAVVANGWYWPSATYDSGDGVERINLNAVEENTKTVGGTINDSTRALAIGSHGTGGNIGELWKGIMDKVLIFNSRLSLVDQLNIINGIVDPRTFSSLALYIDFSRGSGTALNTIVYDKSSNNNNGAMQGFSGTPWINIGIR